MYSVINSPVKISDKITNKINKIMTGYKSEFEKMYVMYETVDPKSDNNAISAIFFPCSYFVYILILIISFYYSFHCPFHCPLTLFSMLLSAATVKTAPNKISRQTQIKTVSSAVPNTIGIVERAALAPMYAGIMIAAIK